MLPIRTIGALFLALVSSLLAKEQEFRFEKPDAQTVDLMAHASTIAPPQARGGGGVERVSWVCSAGWLTRSG
jgi:hypothetical protein